MDSMEHMRECKDHVAHIIIEICVQSFQSSGAAHLNLAEKET